MTVFWEKGYEGTSVDDLVSASRLNTRSMYNRFGDKKGVFHAALDNYRERFLNARLGMLNRNPGLPGIRAFFRSVAESDLSNGCLFCNTLTEGHVVDRGSTRRAEAYFEEVEQRFYRNLRQAKRKGEFSGDPRGASRVLVCLLQGMGIYFKRKITAAEKRRLFETALSFLGGG
jgi:TetR/AcrR family transcriptional repressor of nem operon